MDKVNSSSVQCRPDLCCHWTHLALDVHEDQSAREADGHDHQLGPERPLPVEQSLEWEYVVNTFQKYHKRFCHLHKSTGAMLQLDKLTVNAFACGLELSKFGIKTFGTWITSYSNCMSFFCSSSLPLASARWVRSTFSSHCPLSSNQHCFD